MRYLAVFWLNVDAELHSRALRDPRDSKSPSIPTYLRLEGARTEYGASFVLRCSGLCGLYRPLYQCWKMHNTPQAPEKEERYQRWICDLVPIGLKCHLHSSEYLTSCCCLRAAIVLHVLRISRITKCVMANGYGSHKQSFFTSVSVEAR